MKVRVDLGEGVQAEAPPVLGGREAHVAEVRRQAGRLPGDVIPVLCDESIDLTRKTRKKERESSGRGGEREK